MLAIKPAKDASTRVDEMSARKALLARVVRSDAFAKSERLSSFLSFVGDLTLGGRASEINEQMIGMKLFGRAENYDSSNDGVVRTQASRLRQRLEMYFAEEGADEPVRIILPRGSYAPVFEPRDVTPAAVAPAPAQPVLAPPAVASITPADDGTSPQKLRFPSRSLPWLLTALFATILVVYWAHEHRAKPRPPVAAGSVASFWDGLFRINEATMVVAPDSGLVLFHGFSGQDIDLREYLDASYRSDPTVLPQIGPAASRKAVLLDLANRRYTSIVDARTILRLEDRARTVEGSVSLRYARDLRPNDFKTGNVILLGSSEADPWVELYESKMNFALKDDYKGRYSVINRSPQPGEAPDLESTLDDPQRRVYGVVAYLPNVTGEGNALLLEGTGMSGAEAGMDFVLDDAQLRPFLDRIRHSDGKVPPFELLIEASNVGASAVRSTVLAWRVKD